MTFSLIAQSAGPIDVMGMTLMSFHRGSDQPLKDTLQARIGSGVPVRVLFNDPDRTAGLAHAIRDPETRLPPIKDDLGRSVRL